jgi:hypothetical protein
MVLIMLPVSAFAADYSDIQGNWAQSSIERWTDAGIVGGKTDGDFHPNDFLTRAETAKIIANLLKLTEKADISNFTDVTAGAWYYDAVAQSVKAGYMNGKTATTMDPAGNVTREMFFTIVARALGLSDDTLNATYQTQFTDVAEISNYAKTSVYALINNKIVRGTTTTTIEPQRLITRAMAMVVLDRAIAAYVTEDGQTVTVNASGNDFPGIVLVAGPDVNDVNVEGDGEFMVVVASPNTKLSLKNTDGNVKARVLADGVEITDAPKGTEVTTVDDVEATVNGQTVDEDTTIVVGEEEAAPTIPSTPAATADVSFTITDSASGQLSLSVKSDNTIVISVPAQFTAQTQLTFGATVGANGAILTGATVPTNVDSFAAVNLRSNVLDVLVDTATVTMTCDAKSADYTMAKNNSSNTIVFTPVDADAAAEFCEALVGTLEDALTGESGTGSYVKIGTTTLTVGDSFFTNLKANIGSIDVVTGGGSSLTVALGGGDEYCADGQKVAVVGGLSVAFANLNNAPSAGDLKTSITNSAERADAFTAVLNFIKDALASIQDGTTITIN